MVLESIVECAAAVLSAGGIVSMFICTLMMKALSKARDEATRRKDERNRYELLRMEGEERIASLLLAVSRYTRGRCGESELDEAEKAYLEHIKKSNEIRMRILSDTITE